MKTQKINAGIGKGADKINVVEDDVEIPLPETIEEMIQLSPNSTLAGCIDMWNRGYRIAQQAEMRKKPLKDRLAQLNNDNVKTFAKVSPEKQAQVMALLAQLEAAEKENNPQ